MKEKSRVIGKVIMCGPANVGKTSLIERFVQDAFVPDPGPTLGLDQRLLLTSTAVSGNQGASVLVRAKP